MIKFLDEYRNADLCYDIAENIRKISRKKINIMEVCGGHTMAIRKNGLHKLVGENINLLSGPGCPVCVTAIQDIDRAIAFSKLERVTVCTFGDMFNVPGSTESLADARSQGSDIRIVYSARDILRLAESDRKREFVFISIGFETTAPTAAACLQEAKRKHIDNFSVFSLNKTMPRALRAILENKNSKIDALICPGHVSAITGVDMYRFIVDEFNIPCCVSGFEPSDILTSIYILTNALEKDEIKLINGYTRAVLNEGNTKAKEILNEVFTDCDASWRGVGLIKSSGLKLKDAYKDFNALSKFKIEIPESKENAGCICGDILAGAAKPSDCPLFAEVCTPGAPQGACMVSSEGACGAWYKYRD